jgi:hypothetical protein
MEATTAGGGALIACGKSASPATAASCCGCRRGTALLEVRDRRLYRETHATFEDYCRERWRFSDRTPTG